MNGQDAEKRDIPKNKALVEEELFNFGYNE
jgi:hypothetical protein